MPRPRTGSIEPPKGDRKSWRLRVTFNGKREPILLGTPEEGWNELKAEERLEEVLAEILLGTFVPPSAQRQQRQAQEEEAATAEPTFREYAREWFAIIKETKRPKTVKDYEWALKHLFPFFGDYYLSEINAGLVERYSLQKVTERKASKEGLNNNSVNKTITRLAQILERAYEDELINRNPAKGKRGRLDYQKPKRTWVTPDQLPVVLEAAQRYEGCDYLYPLVSLLAGCGLRIGEAVALDWRDIDLSTGTIHVGAAKTETGEDREVYMPPQVQRTIRTWKVRSPRSKPSDPVFVTHRPVKGEHRRVTETNAQARVRALRVAANKLLKERKFEQLGEVTPHSFRRTYATLRALLGDPMSFTIRQLGHADYKETVRTYQQAGELRDRLPKHRRDSFDQALVWARIATAPEEEAQPAKLEAVS